MCVCVCACVCVGGGVVCLPSLLGNDFEHVPVVLEGWSTRESGAGVNIKRHGCMSGIVLSRITRQRGKSMIGKIIVSVF